jgi:hypothetical protein
LDLLLVLEVELGLDLLDLSLTKVVKPNRGEGVIEGSLRLGWVVRGRVREGGERREGGGGGGGGGVRGVRGERGSVRGGEGRDRRGVRGGIRGEGA